MGSQWHEGAIGPVGTPLPYSRRFHPEVICTRYVTIIFHAIRLSLSFQCIQVHKVVYAIK
jgi:hypothetical protein